MFSSLCEDLDSDSSLSVDMLSSSLSSLPLEDSQMERLLQDFADWLPLQNCVNDANSDAKSASSNCNTSLDNQHCLLLHSALNHYRGNCSNNDLDHLNPPTSIMANLTNNGSSERTSIRIFGSVPSTRQPYSCSVCGKHFRLRGSLVVHQRMAHPRLQLDIGQLQQRLLQQGIIASTNLNLTPQQQGQQVMQQQPLEAIQEHLQQPLEALQQQHQVLQQQQLLQQSQEAPQDDFQLLSSMQPQDQSDESHHRCSECGQSFDSANSLLLHSVCHMRRRSVLKDETRSQKSWQCAVCQKLFTTKYFLRKHQRLHTGEQPYKCSVCQKSFTFQQTYHKHMLYHMDLRPYLCSVCGKTFREASTLRNHQRIHTGERPYQCQHCHKTFRQRVSFLVHQRIHTGATPYECERCGRSFRYKVSWRNHKCKADNMGNVDNADCGEKEKALGVVDAV